MLNEQIAKYALSMSWRFLISGSLVMLVISQFIPLGVTQEQMMENPALGIIFPIAQIVWIYLTMYLSLLWMSYSSKKKGKSVEQ